MCVPLVDSAGRTIGVLELVEKASGGSFTEDDARLLHLFARQAAVALRNSLRVDRLRAVRHAEGALLATVRALCIPARHPTATSAGTPTLKARQGLLTVGEAAQRCYLLLTTYYLLLTTYHLLHARAYSPWAKRRSAA